MIRSKFGMTSPKVQDQLRAHQATADRQADEWVSRRLREYLEGAGYIAPSRHPWRGRTEPRYAR